MYRVWDFVTTYSILLLAGAGAALAWANLAPDSYLALVDWVIWDGAPVGTPYIDGHGFAVRELTLYFLVNDILMAFFFALAGKEVWEALVLRNGALRGRKAATPLIATAGGMLAPAALYLGLAAALGSDTFDALWRGWAVPTSTDIAVSYIIGRAVFGAGHPALRFLLLLAITDDAAGMVILALFYPAADLAPAWLGLSAGAAAVAWLACNWLPRRLDRGDHLRRNSTWVRRRLGFWPYLLAGVLSWYGFMRAGLNPALGLLPVVPAIPHADRAFGIFAEAEQFLGDLLNHIGRLLKHPVEIVLFLFALVNAGAPLAAFGNASWLVLAGLMLGKPAGIVAFGWLAAGPLGLGMPRGTGRAELLAVGLAAATGLTVALYFVSVAFPAGELQDAARLGVVFSLAAALPALAAGRLLGIERRAG